MQAFLKAARLMETVLSIATTARETMSMSRIADLQYDDAATAALWYEQLSPYRASLSVCLSSDFFFPEEKNGLNSAFARYFQFGTGKPLLLYSKSVWKLLGAQGLMINSLAGPGFAGLQVETGFLTSCAKRQCRAAAGKKSRKDGGR